MFKRKGSIKTIMKAITQMLKDVIVNKLANIGTIVVTTTGTIVSSLTIDDVSVIVGIMVSSSLGIIGILRFRNERDSVEAKRSLDKIQLEHATAELEKLKIELKAIRGNDT